MKKSTTLTIGMDLGDTQSELCILGGKQAVRRSSIRTTPGEVRRVFSRLKSESTVIIEAGSQSPWVSRLLKEMGHEVIVANPRNVRLIAQGDRKNDRVDAELLARIGRLDPKLLSPIQHRGAKAHADLLLLKARDTLVALRTKTINTVRGMAKSFGVPLPRCNSDSFACKVSGIIPEHLQLAIAPLLEMIDELDKRIRRYDARIADLADDYPELALLTQVKGVGPITSAAFLLTIEDPDRFKSSRAVGAYLGLTPRQRKSGQQDPQLRITKAGSPMVRRLLVLSAQHVLQAKAPDCRLKSAGLAIAARGGKNAKKRAVVAVARKLAVLLHGLWKRGEVYDPNHHHRRKSVISKSA